MPWSLVRLAGISILALMLLFLGIGLLAPCVVAAQPRVEAPLDGPLAGGAIAVQEGVAAPRTLSMAYRQRQVDGLPCREAADAPLSFGERRARAVAMTVFSLGTVIGAGILVGFLIKRLL